MVHFGSFRSGTNWLSDNLTRSCIVSKGECFIVVPPSYKRTDSQASTPLFHKWGNRTARQNKANIYTQLQNEPPHDKTNKMVCASSEDSDQPGHPP